MVTVVRSSSGCYPVAESPLRQPPVKPKLHAEHTGQQGETLSDAAGIYPLRVHRVPPGKSPPISTVPLVLPPSLSLRLTLPLCSGR